MKYSFNFGSLAEGVLSFAPKPITVDEVKYWTNSEEIHRLGGFLPIERTPKPEGDYAEQYVIEDDIIKQQWIIENGG